MVGHRVLIGLFQSRQLGRQILHGFRVAPHLAGIALFLCFFSVALIFFSLVTACHQLTLCRKLLGLGPRFLGPEIGHPLGRTDIAFRRQTGFQLFHQPMGPILHLISKSLHLIPKIRPLAHSRTSLFYK